MKLSRQSADRLTLRSLSWATWVMSGVMLAIGLSTGTLLMGRSTFECDRTQADRCTITHDYLLRHRTESFPLATLRGAEVETSTDSDGDDTYRLVLLTREGPVPFTQSFRSNWGHHTSQANQVTRFVQTPSQPQVRLHQDSRWQSLLVLLSFGGVGLLMLLNSRVATCEFDKSTNRFALRLWGLLGSDCRQYPLTQLSGLRVELFEDTNPDRDDTKQTGISSRLTLVLKNGEVIPLEKMYAGDSVKQQQLARQVHGFLRLPLLPQWNASPVVIDQGKIALPLITGGIAQRLATIEACRQTLRHDPDNVDAYQQLATALSMQGQKDQAKQLLESARSRYQSYGEFDKAAHLDHVLILLKLKGETNWWDFT